MNEGRHDRDPGKHAVDDARPSLRGVSAIAQAGFPSERCWPVLSS